MTPSSNVKRSFSGERTKTVNVPIPRSRPNIQRAQPLGDMPMANRVVLYFENQEDALLFILASSSVMSAEAPGHRNDAAGIVAAEICKASRITAEGVLNTI